MPDTKPPSPNASPESVLEVPKRNRSVLLTLFAVVLVDICGYTIVLPLLPFYAEHLGANPLTVGTIVSLFALAQMISGPILGRLSDRYGRRPILIVSQIGTLVSFIVLAQATSLWIVYLARVIDGLTAGNITVAQAYVADVTTRQERTRAMGLIGAAFGLGFVIGPAFSAFLTSYGPTAPIWAACVMSLCSIIGSWLFLKDSRKTLPTTGQKRPPLMSAFQDENLRRPLFAFFAFCMAFSLLISGLALFAERRLTWNGQPFQQREIGWVFTLGGLIGLIVQTTLIGPAVKWAHEKKLATLAFISMIAGFCLLSAPQWLFVFLIGYSLIQLGSSFVRPTLNGLISKGSSPASQGFIFGVTQTIMSFTQIVAPLIGGALINYGYTNLWAITGAVLACVGVGLISTAKVAER